MLGSNANVFASDAILVPSTTEHILPGSYGSTTLCKQFIVLIGGTVRVKADACGDTGTGGYNHIPAIISMLKNGSVIWSTNMPEDLTYRTYSLDFWVTKGDVIGISLTGGYQTSNAHCGGVTYYPGTAVKIKNAYMCGYTTTSSVDLLMQD